MAFKIFEKIKDDLYIKYNIFGIKFTFVNKKYINKQSIKRLNSNNSSNCFICDKLNKEFQEHTGYFPNFIGPKTFNEKLLWLKLNYKNPIYYNILDKYEFKNYIKERLGDGYTIPLIKTFDDIDDIDFEGLPNEFVIKLTRGGGNNFVKIIRDKSKADINKIKYDLKYRLALRRRWYSKVYGTEDVDTVDNIPERVIVEKYIEQANKQLYDYKFYCFNGIPKWVLVCGNREKNTVYENYDLNWNLFVPAPKSSKEMTILCPQNFNEMVNIARKLSLPFPFVRVDFYEVDGAVFVGELTFTPNGGFNKYYKEWDYKIGEWLDLSKISPEHLKILPEFADGAKTFLAPNIVEKCIVRKED